jgi:signal transduction histidine kinase
MIVQLLDFTRVRLGGGFPIQPRPGDLRDIYRAVVEEFGAIIELEVDGDMSGIWDTDRLAEALSNITGSAVEHAAPGTPVVIRAYPERGDIVVEISNQGAAIPAALLPLIFEPFRRGQEGKSTTGHLGLGLYIAKQIVLASGGTLDTRSGHGTTTFVMRLPRQPVSPRTASQPIQARA